jgi:hypothetical protein
MDSFIRLNERVQQSKEHKTTSMKRRCVHVSILGSGPGFLYVLPAQVFHATRNIFVIFSQPVQRNNT